MEFRVAPFHKVGHEISLNMKRHYADMEEKEGYGPIDADWRSYIEASNFGNCLVFLAECDKKIVAYSVFMLSFNINHKTKKEASNSAFYIDPEYRAKITGKFLRYINSWLLDKGIDEISYLVRDERIGKLLKRIGMKPTHTLWTLRNEQSI